MTKPNRYLKKRGHTWFYQRAVPIKIQDALDCGAVYLITLATRDIMEARAKRDAIEVEQNRFWGALKKGLEAEPLSRKRHEAEVMLAREMGLEYIPKSEMTMANKGGEFELLSRIMSVVQKFDPTKGRGGATYEEYLEAYSQPAVQLTAESVLGKTPPPSDMLSDAVDYWIDTLLQKQDRRKSDQQRRDSAKPRRRAVRDFISVAGDKPVLEITDDDAVLFDQWLQDRLNGENGAKKISGSLANRHMGNLRKLFSDIAKRRGKPKLPNPFAGFRYEEDPGERPPFSEDWIAAHFLRPSAFTKMSADLRAIFLVCLATGVRPSELINTPPEDIRLASNIPYLCLRTVEEGEGKREIKTKESRRDLPLTGLALEVMRSFPEGFPWYAGKATHASNAINKFLYENELRETPQHTLYCLRHSFADRCRAKNIRFDQMEELMGHSLGKGYKYGAGFDLEAKLRALNQIERPYDPAILTGFGELSLRRKKQIKNAELRELRAAHAAKRRQAQR